MSRIRTITVAALRELLAHIDRPQPVAFTALCDAKAKVTGNTLPGRLLKLTRYRAWIGDFGRMVTNQLHREGMDQLTFTPKPRKWGQHQGLALVVHQPRNAAALRHYLSVQIKGTTSPLYLIEQVESHRRAKRRRLKAVAKEAIAHLLPAKRDEGTNQGTETPIVHRDIDLSHITCISLGGEVFRVEHEPAVVNPPPVPATPAPKPPRRRHEQQEATGFDLREWDGHKLAGP
jgi:hypothetical protein